MSDDRNYHKFKIARKPWYEWLLIVIWFLVEALFFQAAIASRAELESRAAMLYWLVFVVLLLAGLVYWIIRRRQEK